MLCHTAWVSLPGGSCWPGTHSLHLPCLDQGAPPLGFGTYGSIDLSQVPFCVSPLQSFSAGRGFAPTPTPGDIWRRLETFLIVGPGQRAPLASSGWRPGKLLNILQCTKQPPQQRIILPNVQHPKPEKPWLGLIGSFIEQSAGIMFKGRRM